jgi:serine protease Do
MSMRSFARSGAAFAMLVLMSALAAAQSTNAPGAAPSVRGLPDFTDLYEKNGPAVVSIDVTQKSRRARGMPELSEDDPFYEFFRRFGQVPPRRWPEREP